MSNEQSTSFNNVLLSGYSGVGSDPYSVHTGIRICEQFRLSPHGQRNVSGALTNLPVYNVSDERLSFGFGLKHILRNQAINDSGFTLTAFGAALAECFSTKYGAAILYELAKSADPPIDPIPHPYHWKNMIGAVAGALAQSGFGVLIEDFIRLNPFDTAGAKSLASPKSFVQALVELGKLSNGVVKQMTIIGGDVAGWFAAVSEWLFDLRIEIRAEDDKQLYATNETQDPQVIIIYTQEAAASWYTQKYGTNNLENLVFLEAVTKISSHLPEIVPFGGRIVWQSLLPKAFGQSYNELAHEKDIGTAIGSIARVFEGLVFGEGDLDPNIVSEKNKHTPASYGAGLVATLTNYLPELRRFSGKMERATKLSWDEATKSYPEVIRKLEKDCACTICSPVESEAARPPKHGFCRPVLVETIVALGLALSKMIITAQLFPTRSGLQLFYAEQAQKRIATRELPRNMEIFLTIYGNGWNALDAVMLRKCVEIFSGSSPELDLHDNLVALSHEGVCAYLVRLEGSPDSDRPGGSSIMRVVGGMIQKRGKVYSRVRDSLPPEEAVRWAGWEEVKSESFSKVLYCK